MPEGDTIHKVAAALRPRLLGRRIRALRIAPGAWCQATPTEAEAITAKARTITDVRAHGKHLFIELDGTVQLRSHLGMYGSWHRYAPGERWRKPACQASVMLEAGDDVFVCFNAREVEYVRDNSLRARDHAQRVGPDLLAPDLACTLLPGRARELLDAATPLADVLLSQRVAAGIGNVYKSELLFLERLHPLTSLVGTSDAQLARLYARARELLRENLGPGQRITRTIGDGRGTLWVYRRRGKPCLRCGHDVAAAKLGATMRSTYWCPQCQAAPAVQTRVAP